jgi:F1F0 ATPase subunit 2
MTMNDIIYMTLVFIAGFGLGTFFFGVLWFTVKKAVTAKVPAIWFFGSFILRVSIVMLGFYGISPGGWQPLSISVVGFIVARFVVVYFTKSIDKKQTKKEV